MARTILLTGAGFTQGFGGYLAAGMWFEIFNHEEVKKYPRLSCITSTDFDYESVYYKIFSDPQYSDKEKEAIDKAILDAYMSLDNRIRQVPLGDSQPLIHPVNQMIEWFSGTLDAGGFFFTLNQDFYIERWFSSSKCHLHHPYIDNKGWNILRDKYFSDDYSVITPSEPLKHPESLKVSNFHYIKLHGSFNWKRSGGSNMMVIGQDKERRIAEEPLLTEYFNIFKDELNQEGVRLLVIGYSFRDMHVNRVIADSLKNHGLKLVVVAPWQPDDFMKVLNELLDNRPGGLAGNYYPFNKKLSELYLPNDDGWKKIKNILFTF